MSNSQIKNLPVVFFVAHVRKSQGVCATRESFNCCFLRGSTGTIEEKVTRAQRGSPEAGSPTFTTPRLTSHCLWESILLQKISLCFLNSRKATDIAQCYFFLFPKVKKNLRHHFGTITAMMRGLNSIPKEMFTKYLKQWKKKAATAISKPKISISRNIKSIYILICCFSTNFVLLTFGADSGDVYFLQQFHFISSSFFVSFELFSKCT